jgi:hypothetical protein
MMLNKLYERVCILFKRGKHFNDLVMLLGHYQNTRTFSCSYFGDINYLRKYPTLCIISLYIMYVTTFYIKIIFRFPKNNNFMLVTPRTQRY